MSYIYDRAQIALARKQQILDPFLAVFIVRDLQVTKDAGLDDLAWSMYKHGTVTSEVRWLLDLLESATEEER